MQIKFGPDEADALSRIVRGARNYQGGVLLSEKGGVSNPDDIAVVNKYRQVCRSLCSADANLLGFKTWAADPTILTQAQADEIIQEVVNPLDGLPGGWQRRGSSKREHGVPGTKRKTFGVELDGKYRVTQRTDLPLLLRELGDRLMSRCASCVWPYSRSNNVHMLTAAPFEQAYIQRYVPGDPSATLGFHFDSFGSFGELIVGVTLVGSAQLLLRKCGSSMSGDFIEQSSTVMADPRTLVVPLQPLTSYALTGVARYDLKHAIVNTGSTERISVTFRSVSWRKVSVPRPMSSPPARSVDERQATQGDWAHAGTKRSHFRL
mmetsp:Transcript_41484/g.109422  ORF Transcript_41484/g.109422 Transcript_41484/m.109422 type:complete len:320 (-) Transcript_41484:107-1066(-)